MQNGSLITFFIFVGETDFDLLCPYFILLIGYL